VLTTPTEPTYLNMLRPDDNVPFRPD
jgi:hypothetical protein